MRPPSTSSPVRAAAAPFFYSVLALSPRRVLALAPRRVLARGARGPAAHRARAAPSRAAAAFEAQGLPRRNKLGARVPLPALYGNDALKDERAEERMRRAGRSAGGGAAEASLQDELPALRAQLKALGPMGAQLQALALRHAAHSRRTAKHQLLGEREAVSEAAWWNCLLESLGLPSLAALGFALSGGGSAAAVDAAVDRTLARKATRAAF